MTLSQTAWHEAGHAVVAVQHGFALKSVVVHPRRKPDGEAGLTELVMFSNADAVRLLTYLMAGPAAEKRFSGRSACGDSRDREQAIEVARVIHDMKKPADHPDVVATVARAELIARALMLDDLTWAAVQAVAKALEQKRRLSGRDVLCLVRQVCRQVRA